MLLLWLSWLGAAIWYWGLDKHFVIDYNFSNIRASAHLARDLLRAAIRMSRGVHELSENMPSVPKERRAYAAKRMPSCMIWPGGCWLIAPLRRYKRYEHCNDYPKPSD